MTEKQQEKFIELYSFEQKTYPEIEKNMRIKRKDTQKLFKETEEERKKISNIRKKYYTRKEYFLEFKEFYTWYENQKQKCGYCGISQENLYVLFNKENRILPYLDKTIKYTKSPKRSSGTLEIERVDSSKKYEKDNMILACPLCNNAKSNLIDEESWRDFFVPVMKEYYEKLLIK